MASVEVAPYLLKVQIFVDGRHAPATDSRLLSDVRCTQFIIKHKKSSAAIGQCE